MRFPVVILIAICTWALVGALSYRALSNYENYLAERSCI